MSLYVEIGAPPGPPVTEAELGALRERVLADLARERILDGHRLVAHHHVVLDPAYVHITRASLAEAARLRAARRAGRPLIGRYGGWTYCSIEDNLVEARPRRRARAVAPPRAPPDESGGPLRFPTGYRLGMSQRV